MNFDRVVSRLGIGEGADALGDRWDESQAAMPVGELPFLEKAFLERVGAAASLTPEMTRALVDMGARARADEALRRVAWHCHWFLYRESGDLGRVSRWPLLTDALAEQAGMFYALVVVSNQSELEAIVQRRAIPAQIVRETLYDLRRWFELGEYAEDHGAWGVAPRIVAWLRRHWRCELFRIGRFHLAFGRTFSPIRALRNKADGAVVAVSEGGVRFRSDGQIDGAGGVSDESGAWTSRFEEADGVIAAHPIHPDGYAVQEPIRLPADRWRQELAPGDPVVEIHIPYGPPMAFDVCGQSLRDGMAFFREHFPDRPFVGFTCVSWLLDSQFEDLLPPTSNLVRFQQETYRFPYKGTTLGTVQAVFGRQVTDVRSAPRKTSMQHAFARHVESGGHFRAGGCFLLPDDFDWGSQFYRRQRLPWETHE